MSLFQEPFLGKGATNIPISNSEIQMFKENKREWFLRYYLGLTPKNKKLTGPLPLGTRIHYALEKMYGEGVDPVQAYNEQLQQDMEEFQDSHQSSFEDENSKFSSDAELGRIMVEGYAQWVEETGVDANWEVLGVETEVSYPFFDGRANVRGKVDMKVRDTTDDARLVVDVKTAIQFSMYHDIAHMSEQLMMYALLERLQNPDDLTPVEGGVYNLLKKVKRSPKAKPPFYERITVRFNPTLISNFHKRLEGTVWEMLRVRDLLDQGVDHHYICPPTISKDLTWKSDFFPVYHMMDDGSSAEQWLQDYAEVSDPYARYDSMTEERK